MGIEQWEWDLALYGTVYFRWEERGVEGGRWVLVEQFYAQTPTHKHTTFDVVALRLRAYEVTVGGRISFPT